MTKLPALMLLLAVAASAQVRGTQAIPIQPPFLKRDTASRVLYARILEAEDRREFSKQLAELLVKPHAGVRRRAAIAIGRIGDPAGVAPLVQQLDNERIVQIRADIAFALGEIEDSRATAKLLDTLTGRDEPAAVRARAAEALGKIGSNPAAAVTLGQGRLQEIAAAIVAQLPATDKTVLGDELVLGSLGITALLRLKLPSTLPALTAQLSSKTPDLRWLAANAIARMKPDPAAASGAVEPLVAMLKSADPVERANAVRALGAVKAVRAADAIVALLADRDQRVQASAIRVLGALADKRAVEPLNLLGERLLAAYRSRAEAKGPGVPEEQNLLLLVAEALGALKDSSSLPLLQHLRVFDGHAGSSPETEIAVAAFGEAAFFDVPPVPAEWHHESAYAQGLGALGGDRACHELVDMVAGKRFGALDSRAMTDALTALAVVKPDGLEQILIDQLGAQDFYVRATAATLLAESFAPSQSELTFKALDAALAVSAKDRETDARLAILDGIAKYKRQRALDLLSGALNDPDYVVRRHAAELLEAADAGSFRAKAPPATTPARPHGYYERVEAAMRQPNPTAIIATEKGEIRVELLMRDAPMTADNFMALAGKGFFDGIVFHRVVPNFVVQGGDPRGDGNGGPGYQIRCEINEAPYDRGAVGMALSGKDTGGSQFFFTHSPQPHLDGGYTVFARVISGMEVVDRLARGDRIVSVKILNGGRVDSKQ